MNTVNRLLGMNIQPLTLWYIMCLALDNQHLVSKQLIHCKESIEKDFPNVEPHNLLLVSKPFIQSISYFEIPFENVLDYNCLITMEDTSKTGGYRFLPHNNILNNNCCPVYVLSIEGYKQLLNNKNTSICPICYTFLNESHFQLIGPKPESFANLAIFSSSEINIFDNNNKNAVNVNNLEKLTLNDNNKSLNKKGTIIIMKGVVGSGKSTYATRIKDYIEKMDSHCFIESTDTYCKIGINISDAISRITEELLKINDITDNKPIVVIIDTCGEHNNKNNSIFGLNFTGWNKINLWPNLDRKNMEGYLSWSLRNVLQRNKPNDNDNFYLNPIDAGFNVCINVHKKKTTALFGKKIPSLFPIMPNTIEEAIHKINDNANTYQKWLESSMQLDNEVDNFVKTQMKNFAKN